MWWDISLETDIPILDKQHKEIFRQVNDVLLDADNKTRVDETLDLLDDYILDHIQIEELMQECLGYPKMAEHRKMHEEFARTIPAMRKEYREKGYDSSTVMKNKRNAVDWLRAHILLFDMDFAEYVKRRKRRTHTTTVRRDPR